MRTAYKSIGAIFALAGLLVAMRSCFIEDRTLTQSDKHFLADKRPIINITPAMSPTSKSFFLFSMENGRPSVIIQYLVKNVGSAAANKMTIESIKLTSQTFNIMETIAPPTVSLNPGEEIVMSIKALSSKKPSDFDFKSVDKVGVRLVLTYMHESDSKTVYKNDITHSIMDSNVDLVASETSSNRID